MATLGRVFRPWTAALMTALMWLLPGTGDGQSSLPIAVVVPLAETESLQPTELALIYRRKKQFWSGGARVLPVNLPADSVVRQRFSEVVLGDSPEQMEEYWNQQYFQGVLPPHVLASEAAVQRFVSETRHAIGYLPFCSPRNGVRVVLVIDAAGRVLGPDARIDCPAAP